MTSKTGEDYDLSANIRENFNPKKKWKDAITLIKASNKFKMAGASKPEPLDTDSSEDGFRTATDDDESNNIKPKSSQPGMAGLVDQVKDMKV